MRCDICGSTHTVVGLTIDRFFFKGKMGAHTRVVLCGEHYIQLLDHIKAFFNRNNYSLPKETKNTKSSKGM